MTTQERMEKQRAFHNYQYAYRLVKDKDTWLSDFELRTRLYGKEWAKNIWDLCRAIKKGEL